MVVQFFEKADYLKVLEGGPLTVLGHYLTITKWRPNFVPRDNEVINTLIWERFS